MNDLSPKPPIWKRWWFWGIVVFVIIVTSRFEQNRTGGSGPRVDEALQPAQTLEYNLALLNAGGYVKDDDITVARFRTLLELLSEKFVEDRQQIANMTVKAQSMLRDKGVSESLLDIMEGMNGLFYSDVRDMKYAEYVAAYVTMRIQGLSHDDAIHSLRALLKSLGVF